MNRNQIIFEFEFNHSIDNKTNKIIIQIWKYINGRSDGGFSCYIENFKNRIQIDYNLFYNEIINKFNSYCEKHKLKK